MIQNKQKKCKGTGRAVGYGCGELSADRKYGLSKTGCKCFYKWLYSTKEGGKVIKSYTIKGKRYVEKKEKEKRTKEKKDIKTVKDLKPVLQKEVNTISRLIDAGKGCISCGHGWKSDWTRVKNAGHYHSVGSHDAIRFNLHNIYLQCVVCNDHLSSNKGEYSKRIVIIYGQEVLDKIEALPLKYKEMHLTKTDLLYAIKEARKIIREIKEGRDFTREEVNKKLNIYTN